MVMGDLFHVEERLVKDYIHQAQAQEAAFLSVQDSLDGLFDFATDAAYVSKLATTEKLIQEFKEKAYVYADNPLSLTLESYALNLPKWLVAKTRSAPRLRYFMTRRPMQALFSILNLNPFELRKHRDITSAVKEAVNSRWAANVNEKVVSIGIGRNTERAYYNWLNGAVALSHRFMLADWLETIVGATAQVAEEGSPKAAYLYFSRLTRIFVPDNFDESKKREAFIGNIGNMAQYVTLHNNGFIRAFTGTINLLSDLTSNIKREFPLHKNTPEAGHLSTDSTTLYSEMGKIGLDEVLGAIDLEDRRTRYRTIGFGADDAEASESNPGRFYTFKASLKSFNEVFGFFDFAAVLQKVGASPKTAGEILINVPIGQRKSALSMLAKKPELVLLYEHLQGYGVDARAYVSFATELANINVAVEGQQATIFDVVREVAEAGHYTGASWLLRNPGVLSGSDLQSLVVLAQSAVPELTLELYKKWNDDPVKKRIVVELAPNLLNHQVLSLAVVLATVPSDKLSVLVNPTLEEVVALGQSQSPTNEILFKQPASEPLDQRARRFAWINLTYQNNLTLVDALLKAYDAVPPHLQHRIKELSDYVQETVEVPGREEVMLRYTGVISGMSPKLISYLFRTSDFFDTFLKQIPDDGLIGTLEEAVKKKNPYGDLHSILLGISDKQARVNTDGHSNSHVNGRHNPEVVIKEGVVYKIAIFGYFDSRKQNLLRSKLSGTAIEPIFFTKDVRGTYPDCDGVAIFPGASTGLTVPHFSASQGHYASHKVPIKAMGRMANVDKVAEALIEFGNELFLKSYDNLSA